jgi:hypothetical protein
MTSFRVLGDRVLYFVVAAKGEVVSYRESVLFGNDVVWAKQSNVEMSEGCGRGCESVAEAIDWSGQWVNRLSPEKRTPQKGIDMEMDVL